MPGDRWSRFKANAAFLGAFVLFGALIVRLYGLQILEHDAYAAVHDSQSRATVDLRVPRGAIRDARGEVLAISVPATSIAMDPTKLSGRAPACTALAKALGLEPVDVARLLDRRLMDGRPSQFVWLRRFASDAQVKAVRALKLPGVSFVTEFDRRYPHGTLLAHALGIVDIDERGSEGLEQRLDAALKGRSNPVELEVDARRHKLDFPESGVETFDASLTIDIRFQEIVEEELDAACAKFHPKWACVVAIDPRTGAVLAIANRPGFDPNEPSPRGMTSLQAADARRNRVVTDPFEPGSTFKPFVVAAALEEGLITPGTKFDCEMGEWKCGSRVLHDHDPFGVMTVTDIVAKSSNIGAVKIGLKLGSQRLHHYVRDFGFGSKTGIDLPAEGSGVVHPLSRWNSYSISSVPMGHEVSATPLQMVEGMAVLANGGCRVRPFVVKETALAPRHRVIREETAAKVRAMLAEVMVSGTGREIRVEGVPLAGKTGTTQKIDRHGTRTGYISSFVGFAPVENARVVIAVVVDEPRGAYYGGAVAAPVFGNIVRRGISLLD